MARSILLILALPYTLRFSLFEQYWALCLSLLHEVPTGSRCRQDKHKAPTLPYIRPLSLQDGDRRIPEFGR